MYINLNLHLLSYQIIQLMQSYSQHSSLHSIPVASLVLPRIWVVGSHLQDGSQSKSHFKSSSVAPGNGAAVASVCRCFCHKRCMRQLFRFTSKMFQVRSHQTRRFSNQRTSRKTNLYESMWVYTFLVAL